MTTFLETSVENRLTAWLKIKGRQDKKRSVVKLPTITISRRFGCEAFSLAEKLKKLLKKETGHDWVIFDRSLLERVSTQENLDKHSLEKVGDFSHGLDFFATFLPSVRTHDELFNSIAVTIKDIAAQGGAIIIGRGGAILTHNYENCFHFRLDAPFDFRVQSVMRRYNKDKQEAESFVNHNEEYREEFLNHFFNEDVKDIKFYDVIFNNSKIDTNEMSQQILGLIKPSLTSSLGKSA